MCHGQNSNKPPPQPQDSLSLAYTHFVPGIQSNTNLGPSVKGLQDAISVLGLNQLSLNKEIIGAGWGLGD